MKQKTWVRSILVTVLLALLAGGLFAACRPKPAEQPPAATEPPEATLSPEEAERIRREEAEKAAARAEERRRQAQLEEGLRAWNEGRLEEAAELVKASGLRPELLEEIEQARLRERDARTADRARAALEELDLGRALTLAEEVANEEIRTALRREIEDGWAQKQPQLRGKYKNALFAGAWYSLSLGDAPRIAGDRRYEGLEESLAGGDLLIGGAFSWIRIKDGRVELIGDNLGAEKAAGTITDAVGGALGLNHGLILRADGTVTLLGARQYGRGDAESWTDITAVAAGAFHSLGLTRAGTVVAAGLDLDGQCQVSQWTDVVAVAAGLRHSVGLTKDGRVLAAGDDSFGQCGVSGWENVVDIRCGADFTLGLTADGHLLAAGDNDCGQCDVSGWENVIAFDGGFWHTVALLQDGRVVAVGANGRDQLSLRETKVFETGVERQKPADSEEEESELVYVGDPLNGPWLYCSGEGAVIVAFDADSGRIKATRADLICTWGHPPVGIFSGGGDRPGQSVSASKLARQNRAVFALTGDYFTYGSNADGLQIRRGRVIRQKKKERGFGFYPDGSMRIIDPNETTAEDLLAAGVNDSWVFGPTLIEHGGALDIHKHPLAHDEVTMRTVMGTFCPYHHMGAAYGFSTLAQVVDNLLDYGCETAYNLDGGRSSMMVFLGKTVNKSAFVNQGWRGLRDMVGFLTSDLVK